MLAVTDYTDLVARALAEDLGDRGDITSAACVPESSRSEAVVVARARGVIAGLDVARHVFATVDPGVEFVALAVDGDRVEVDDEIARVEGSSRSLLTAERTALNLLGRMSGVATATSALVDLVAGTRARISDTRKTMPGMRVLDKYAVTAGGGVNHRFGLYDAVMIKDNHLVAAGSIGDAVAAARAAVESDVMIVVEVTDLDQLAELLETDADRALLDNMTASELTEAVSMVDGRMTVEASGGITLETVRAVAETGVDIISVGWITHSAPQLDIALDFVS